MTIRMNEKRIKAFNAALTGEFARIERYHRNKIINIVTVRDDKGNTLLHAACDGGNLQIVEFLLSHNVPVNIQNQDGDTALHLACGKGLNEIVAVLINARADPADPNILNQNNESPLHYAAAFGNVTVIGSLNATPFHFLNFDNPATDGATPLIRAISAGKLDFAMVLINNGANLQLAKNDGVTALHLAAWNGTVILVKALMDAGALMTSSNKGNFPLHTACIGGKIEIVEELLRRGANVTDQNMEGKTPIQIAREKNFDGIVSLLEKPRPQSHPPSSRIHRVEDTRINNDLEMLRHPFNDYQIQLAQKTAECDRLTDLLENERRRNSQNIQFRPGAPNSAEFVECKLQLASKHEELTQALARERQLREELHALRERTDRPDPRVAFVLQQTADDTGLDIDSLLELQVLRRNIMIRMREHRYHRLHEDIAHERDFDTLGALGAQLRALQFDPDRDLKGLLIPSDIHNRSLTLLATTDHRWRELLTHYVNEEASERCRLNRDEFLGLFRKWEKIEIEGEFIRRAEDVKARWSNRASGGAQVNLEELTKLSADLQRISLDERRRRIYEDMITQIRNNSYHPNML